MAGWLHGVFVGDWLFVFPLCGFSLSLFCNYLCKLQSEAACSHRISQRRPVPVHVWIHGFGKKISYISYRARHRTICDLGDLKRFADGFRHVCRPVEALGFAYACVDSTLHRVNAGTALLQRRETRVCRHGSGAAKVVKGCWHIETKLWIGQRVELSVA